MDSLLTYTGPATIPAVPALNHLPLAYFCQTATLDHSLVMVTSLLLLTLRWLPGCGSCSRNKWEASTASLVTLAGPCPVYLHEFCCFTPNTRGCRSLLSMKCVPCHLWPNFYMVEPCLLSSLYETGSHWCCTCSPVSISTHSTVALKLFSRA